MPVPSANIGCDRVSRPADWLTQIKSKQIYFTTLLLISHVPDDNSGTRDLDNSLHVAVDNAGKLKLHFQLQ